MDLRTWLLYVRDGSFSFWLFSRVGVVRRLSGRLVSSTSPRTMLFASRNKGEGRSSLGGCHQVA